ncbi:E3 ubiquitin-protein ligase MARCH [Sporobolomyces salmoneus]|uniref:E3 ubiquitin-protein ligase MARCH n=1 Tax=Sporobolomyces salmoneus TaxID=183962 RepID=UPI003180766F
MSLDRLEEVEPISTLRQRHPTTVEPTRTDSDTAPKLIPQISPDNDLITPTWQPQEVTAQAEQHEEAIVGQLTSEDKEVEEGDEMTPMPSTKEPRERRESIVTEDGEEDRFVEELLRPQSRAESSSKEENDSTRADSASSERNSTTDQAEERTEEKMCRICFDSEDESLGRLFSPCRCRGSSRYVHTECLAAWRKATQNSSSFYRCPSCLYEYRFRRAFVGNLINSRFSVLSLTILSFLLLSWIAGFLANSLLSAVEARSSAWQGTPFDDFFVADHILLGEGVRESLSFFTSQLEDSRWSTARKIAHQARIQDQARSNLDAGIVARITLHFTKGIATLGLLSVFYTYIATTFVSPLGRTLFRAIRPAGGRRRAGDNSASMGRLIIVIVIVVGIARAVQQVYRGVRWLSRRVLTRLEDLVLEVN